MALRALPSGGTADVDGAVLRARYPAVSPVYAVLLSAVAVQLAARAQHPTAAVTTMLITLGGLKPAPETVLVIAIGVALVAALGEGARLLHPDRRGLP